MIFYFVDKLKINIFFFYDKKLIYKNIKWLVKMRTKTLTHFYQLKKY